MGFKEVQSSAQLSLFSDLDYSILHLKANPIKYSISLGIIDRSIIISSNNVALASKRPITLGKDSMKNRRILLTLLFAALSFAVHAEEVLTVTNVHMINPQERDDKWGPFNTKAEVRLKLSNGAVAYLICNNGIRVTHKALLVDYAARTERQYSRTRSRRYTASGTSQKECEQELASVRPGTRIQFYTGNSVWREVHFELLW